MFKSHASPALFEIRLRSPHKDILLVKGNQFECDAIPFEGSVKLSIPTDMHVKRIRLALTGDYTVEYFERAVNGSFPAQMYDHQCVLRVEWPNLLTNAEGTLRFGDYADSMLRMSKLEALLKKSRDHHSSRDPPSRDLGSDGSVSPARPPARPVAMRTSSQPHLDRASPPASLLRLPKSGVDGTPFEHQQGSNSHLYLLPKGNYNLPFRVYLPANTLETVEGLKTAKLLYKLECVVERGRFEKPFHCTKHVRIMRTLHPQNLNLTDSIDLNNTWVEKVQYNVSVPKRGLALGASIPVRVLIIPIAKGLTFKGLLGVLVQHYHCVHSEGTSPEFEELLGAQKISVGTPSGDSWDLKGHFRVPESLHTVTQTCDLKNGLIQVKHRLRVQIQLRNKEGHVSELRANLPVCVYVSANTGHVLGRRFAIDSTHGHIEAESEIEEPLFRRPEHVTLPPQSPGLGPEDDSGSDNDLDREPDAPPLYQRHVFDQIYDLNLPQSPLEQLRSHPGLAVNLDSYFDVRPEISIKDTLSSSLPSSYLDLAHLLMVPSYAQAVEEDEGENGLEWAPRYEGGQDEQPPLLRSQSAALLGGKKGSLFHKDSGSGSSTSLEAKALKHHKLHAPRLFHREKGKGDKE